MYEKIIMMYVVVIGGGGKRENDTFCILEEANVLKKAGEREMHFYC